MDCLFCDDRTQVTNSRKSGQNKIWRRRKCQTCKKTFTTQETPNLENLLLISSDNSKKPTPYNRAKLQLSLLKACDHLIKQQALHIQALVNTVENELLKNSEATNIIKANNLTNIVTNTLKRLDSVAYLKYCANYNIVPDKKTIRSVI